MEEVRHKAYLVKLTESNGHRLLIRSNRWLFSLFTVCRPNHGQGIQHGQCPELRAFRVYVCVCVFQAGEYQRGVSWSCRGNREGSEQFFPLQGIYELQTESDSASGLAAAALAGKLEQ
jgi:hypothetical protein